jgi:hypothetical protein
MGRKKRGKGKRKKKKKEKERRREEGRGREGRKERKEEGVLFADDTYIGHFAPDEASLKK